MSLSSEHHLFEASQNVQRNAGCESTKHAGPASKPDGVLHELCSQLCCADSEIAIAPVLLHVQETRKPEAEEDAEELMAFQPLHAASTTERQARVLPGISS